jgi:hypothetical protein
MKKRIVGIASLPERIECLKDTIDSLYNQVDEIIVGLNNYKVIPDFLKKEKIKSFLLDNSLGDAAKFYKIDEYKNCYYYACDDDIIYPNNFCEILEKKLEIYKGIIGLHGVVIKKPVKSYYKDRIVYHGFSPLNKDVEVDLVATSSCLIDTSILKISLNDFQIPNMADIWLGDLAKKQNVKSIAISRGNNWLMYSPKMKDKWTIYDHYKKRKDTEQTKIVINW